MTVNPWKLQQWSRSAFYVSGAILAFILTIAVLSARQPLAELAETANRAARRVDGAAGNIETASAAYTEQLASARNRKAIDAGIAVGASLQGTVRLVNTRTIPELNETLAEMRAATIALRNSIARTDESLNAQLLPAVTKTVETIGGGTEGVLMAAQQTIAETGLTITDFRKLVSDPEWLAMVKDAHKSVTNIDAASAEVARMMVDLHETQRVVASDLLKAANEVPGIAKDIKGITAASKWTSRLMIAARLFGVLAAIYTH